MKWTQICMKNNCGIEIVLMAMIFRELHTFRDAISSSPFFYVMRPIHMYFEELCKIKFYQIHQRENGMHMNIYIFEIINFQMTHWQYSQHHKLKLLYICAWVCVWVWTVQIHLHFLQTTEYLYSRRYLYNVCTLISCLLMLLPYFIWIRWK